MFSRDTYLIRNICIMWLMECSRLLTKMYFNFDVKFRSPQQLLSVIWSDSMYGYVCFDAARIHVYNQGEFDGVSPRTRPLLSIRVSLIFYSSSWGSSLTLGRVLGIYCGKVHRRLNHLLRCRERHRRCDQITCLCLPQILFHLPTVTLVVALSRPLNPAKVPISLSATGLRTRQLAIKGFGHLNTWTSFGALITFINKWWGCSLPLSSWATEVTFLSSRCGRHWA